MMYSFWGFQIVKYNKNKRCFVSFVYKNIRTWWRVFHPDCALLSLWRYFFISEEEDETKTTSCAVSVIIIIITDNNMSPK